MWSYLNVPFNVNGCNSDEKNGTHVFLNKKNRNKNTVLSNQQALNSFHLQEYVKWDKEEGGKQQLYTR